METEEEDTESSGFRGVSILRCPVQTQSYLHLRHLAATLTWRYLQRCFVVSVKNILMLVQSHELSV